MRAPRKRPNISIAEKHKVLQYILQNFINAAPRPSTMVEAAVKFNISRRSINNIWKEAKSGILNGEAVQFNKKERSTHKDKMVLDKEKIKTLSVLERSTIRKMAIKLGMSKSNLHRFIQDKALRAHTSAIRPHLSEANKLARLKFSLSQLIIEQAAEMKVSFPTMNNVVHIDEKWFYMTKTTDRYYLLPEETDPHRSCQSKRFIGKVMFMAAVARPQFDREGAVIFDGKIGIFPFTEQIPAKRNSKNRSKGTLETKPIQSITKDVIKNCIITQVSLF